MSTEERALYQLGERLRASGYRFVTPTPATHQRVNARAEHAEATTIEGALGWSRPFRAAALPADVVSLLADAGVLRAEGERCRSTVRVSTIAAAHVGDGEVDVDVDAALYVHSAHPTIDPDAVFFGPDTYRFVSALRQDLRPARRLVDIAAGSGAGALSVIDRCERVVLADINPLALRYARINAALARCTDRVEVIESDVLADVGGEFDAVIANPPYLADRHARTYRDGGGALGLDLSLRIVREGLARLAPGGQLILYTGSPVIAGAHPLRAALRPILATRTCRARWRELDPDVFGEELEAAPYDRVDRIAVIALVVDVA